MARQMIILVVLLVAVAGGLVMAEPPKAAPGVSASTPPAAESPDNIGPVDDPAGSEGGDDVVEGPVGGPTSLGEYGSAAAPTGGASGAATVKRISVGVGGAAAALAGLFLY